MVSPKFYRNPKLDKVFDELRPILRAKLVSGEYGKPLNEAQQPLAPLQQLQQQLLEHLHNCRQQIAYYTALENIYQERYRQLLEPTSCLSYNTSHTKKSANANDDNRVD